jgi:hypothetical protein
MDWTTIGWLPPTLTRPVPAFPISTTADMRRGFAAMLPPYLEWLCLFNANSDAKTVANLYFSERAYSVLL